METELTMRLRVMGYNIEHMRKLFFKGAVAPDQRERFDAIVEVINEVDPHLLGVVEASDKASHHELFLRESGLAKRGFKVAKSSKKRQKQDLVYYYRAPLTLKALDEEYDFYEDWVEDIDEDGIKEVCSYERRPLEALFGVQGTEVVFRAILVSTKSKGVFSVNDLHRYEHLALANRKRQLAQIKRLRQRVDKLLDSCDGIPFLLLGDFNDEPGLDSFERVIGASTIETMMGDVFHPERILHNALYHMSEERGMAKELCTTEYPDLIVQNLRLHKGWLDHIFTSPCTLKEDKPFQIVPRSGRVAQKSERSRLASDHFAVFCDFDCVACDP